MGQTPLDIQLRSQLAAPSNKSPRDPREKWSLESESQASGCQNKGLVLASGEHFGILRGYGQEGHICLNTEGYNLKVSSKASQVL